MHIHIHHKSNRYPSETNQLSVSEKISAPWGRLHPNKIIGCFTTRILRMPMVRMQLSAQIIMHIYINMYTYIYICIYICIYIYT